ncbi:hypothetical protein MRX96_017807 [Rhipicephalus microplus]
MAAAVLSELRAHIDQVTARDLQYLPQVPDWGWFSRFRSLQPEVAIPEIHHILEECDSAPHFDYHSLLIDISRAMQSLTVQPVFFGMLSYPGIHHGCIIRNFIDPTTRTWETVFVVLWSGQRFAAASVKTKEQQQTLLTSLHVALSGESVELLDGLHADLENAYRAGCRCPNMDGPALLRHDRDLSIAMRLLPNGHPLVQAEE